MSGTDKMKHAAEELKGHAKEAVGKASGNDRLVAEGKVDQAKGEAKQAADKATDAAKDAFGK